MKHYTKLRLHDLRGAIEKLDGRGDQEPPAAIPVHRAG